MIYITDRNSVPAYCGVPITHIISIGHTEDCPNIHCFRDKDFNLYRFAFQDESNSQTEKPPTKKIMQRMIDIFSTIDIKTDYVLFHCAAGISRSTASAFVLNIMNGKSYEESYKEILKSRYPSTDLDKLWEHRNMLIQPNKLMIYYADEILKKNGEMIDYIKKISDNADWTFK